MSADLVAAFVAAAPSAAAAMPDLPERLAALVAEARAAWPAIEVSDADLGAHLGARLAGDAPELPSGPRAADLYLACACARGDEAAIIAFQTRYFGEVEAACRRARAPDGVAAEVRQNLARALFAGGTAAGPAIGTYAGRGDLRGWVRVTAIREVLRLTERARREVPVGDAAILDALSPVSDPELAFLKERYRADFEETFRAAFAALSDRERALFRHQLIDGWGIDDVAAHHGVHRSTAARWLASARQTLLEETHARLKARWGATTVEVESIVRVLSSRLDTGLESVVRTQ